MKIQTHKFTKSEKDRFKRYLDKQVISDPTEELRIIYERRILYEISHLRAEKYDSPEHIEELRKIQEKTNTDNVPRGNQNPNFDRLLKYYDDLLASPSKKPLRPAITIQQAVDLLNDLHIFIMGFNHTPKWEYTPLILNPQPDPRCVQDKPNLFFGYLLTQFVNKLHDREAKKFAALTNDRFDPESITDTLSTLRKLITTDKFEEFQTWANDILQAVDQPAEYQSPESGHQLDTPELMTTLPDFLQYIESTYR
jgi:hypothetical protein